MAEQALEQRLREILGDLPPEDVHAIIAFAQFLSVRRQIDKESAANHELSENTVTCLPPDMSVEIIESHNLLPAGAARVDTAGTPIPSPEAWEP